MQRLDGDALLHARLDVNSFDSNRVAVLETSVNALRCPETQFSKSTM